MWWCVVYPRSLRLPMTDPGLGVSQMPKLLLGAIIGHVTNRGVYVLGEMLTRLM